MEKDMNCIHKNKTIVLGKYSMCHGCHKKSAAFVLSHYKLEKHYARKNILPLMFEHGFNPVDAVLYDILNN